MIIKVLIRALLEENSVIITGLGTFFVKKLPAQVKEEIIYPPQNMIEFEYSKEVEGFDFVSKLSKWEQIRIDEAQAEITQWLNLLEKGLEHNPSVFFDDFGTFSKDENGKIVFQSMINSQLNMENEGLEPVLIPSKNKEKMERHIEKPVKDKRIILTKRLKKRDKFWFAFTIFIAVATLGALFLKDTMADYYRIIFKNEGNMAIENIEPESVAYISDLTEEEDDIIFIDEIVSNETEIVSNAVKEVESNAPANSAAVAKVVPPKSNDNYLIYREGEFYVIAGSFTNEQDALRHIKEKKLDKYQAKLIVQPDNPRIRVCIGVFDNERDAKGFAARIDEKYWVLK